ncbi:MAG: AAA family ATPase [Caldilineaceae bacterium]|nr:AAA family ATPase [Caldilineaceae bacterium]
MIHLRSVAFRPPAVRQRSEWPFTVPVIADWSAPLEFEHPVTFLVGENGCGKSTLLEGIACHAGLPAAGREELERDSSLAKVRGLAKCLKATWNQRSHRGFFLRAEDFFGFVQRVGAMAQSLRADLEEVDRTYAGRSAAARMYARTPYANELHGITERYGGDMDAQSHGEGFLAFFQARFVPDGLYLLDEPETPLSPLRQLGLLSLLREMVEERGAQFVISTHSPILMAYPGATILSLDESPWRQVAWDELEHVRLTRSFLNNPSTYTKHL